jgi:menaquinone-specific isochorismate synthase
VDLVWLRDANHKTAIIAKGWHSEPASQGLSFYAPYFYRHGSQNPWLWGHAAAWPGPVAAVLPPVVRQASPDLVSFTEIHSEILNGIRERRFSKVVPFVREEIEFARPLEWSMCATALADPGPQFAYGFQFQGDGMWGVTPELLFRVEDGILHTMALAGTGKLGGPSLLEDPKEILEHEIVVDGVLDALAGLGQITVGKTREQDYPFLKHLLTPVQVKLHEAPVFLDLVERLHPTPALGGHPRQAALDFLRVRGGERARFGAPFGFTSETSMTCVVAIRNLQWSGAQAWLLSGCGVVEGSQAEREWNELALKRRSTARQLGLEL